jgi:hypothetical protein
MNWRRGLFRLWLVLSLFWVGIVAYDTYDIVLVPRQMAADAQVCVEARNKNKGLGNPADCVSNLPGGMFADLMPLEPILIQRALAATLPPLVLLLIGVVLGWVASGFRRPQP